MQFAGSNLQACWGLSDVQQFSDRQSGWLDNSGCWHVANARHLIWNKTSLILLVGSDNKCKMLTSHTKDVSGFHIWLVTLPTDFLQWVMFWHHSSACQMCSAQSHWKCLICLCYYSSDSHAPLYAMKEQRQEASILDILFIWFCTLGSLYFLHCGDWQFLIQPGYGLIPQTHVLLFAEIPLHRKSFFTLGELQLPVFWIKTAYIHLCSAHVYVSSAKFYSDMSFCPVCCEQYKPTVNKSSDIDVGTIQLDLHQECNWGTMKSIFVFKESCFKCIM